MKALVLKAKNAATMVLECNAAWLHPSYALVVEESLGHILAAKYNLEVIGEKDLEPGRKWKIVHSETVKKVPVVKDELVEEEAIADAEESLENAKSTKDMGSKKAKKKTRAKKVATK